MNDIVNPTDIQKLVEKDSTFLLIIEKYGIPENWKREQGFISVCKIILEQQVSLASANAHFQKLSMYIPEFTPSAILKLSDAELRMCHLSRQKATYLRALSTAVIDQKICFERLPMLDEQEIREKLTQVKGIGSWTSEIYMMFCLQLKDLFPIGDIAVLHTVRELYGQKTKEEICALSNRWKPFRSLATYFFWHYYLRSRNRA